jgi:hypothetical protein
VDRHLVLEVGLNLGELGLNVLGLGGLATDADEGVDGLVGLALLDKVARRVGEDGKTAGKDDSPEL